MTEKSSRPMTDPDGKEPRRALTPDAAPDSERGQSPGLSGEFGGYISYGEMQEVARSLGELLHRIVDLYLALTSEPRGQYLN